MFLKYQKMTVFFLAVIFFTFLDRFLKSLALNYFSIKQINLVGDLIKFNLVKNYHIAFSLPFTGQWLNILIIAIIICLLYCLLYLLKKQKYWQVNFLLAIILGASSNLLDRLKYGYVIDYFDLKYFTVFNLADVTVVGGVIGLILTCCYKNIWDLKNVN